MEHIRWDIPADANTLETTSSPHIRLEFFRHDEKNGEYLSVQWVENSIEKSKNHPSNETLIAHGTSFERTKLTAILRGFYSDKVAFLVTKDQIPHTPFQEFADLIVPQMPLGQKLRTEKQLEFNLGSEEFTRIIFSRFLNSKDALLFQFEDSDRMIGELGDESAWWYTQMAKNVANIILKYHRILPRWNEIQTRGDISLPLELQRTFGSHQSVTECFIMKVLELTQGREAVLSFIQSFPDKNGFSFGEGFVVTLSQKDGKTNIILDCNYVKWLEVSEDILLQIAE